MPHFTGSADCRSHRSLQVTPVNQSPPSSHIVIVVQRVIVKTFRPPLPLTFDTRNHMAICPVLRVPFPRPAGRQAVPLPLSDRDGSAWRYGRERRVYASSQGGRSNNANLDVSMRAGSGRTGRGRRVEIEGSGGEKRRVQRRSRKPDLRSMRRIGVQVGVWCAVWLTLVVLPCRKGAFEEQKWGRRVSQHLQLPWASFPPGGVQLPDAALP